MARDNHIRIELQSIGENVAIARMLLGSMLAPYDLQLDELDEIRIALSEAVSNAIIHGYGERDNRTVVVEADITDDALTLVVADEGAGIVDIRQAMAPAFSTREEHMGLGFVFMETFMDNLEVVSAVGQGTTVTMRKRLAAQSLPMAEAM